MLVGVFQSIPLKDSNSQMRVPVLRYYLDMNTKSNILGRCGPRSL